MYKIAFALLAVLLLQTVALAKDPPPITDDTITDQVKIKLAGDHVVKGGGLGVNVVNGVATTNNLKALLAEGALLFHHGHYQDALGHALAAFETRKSMGLGPDAVRESYAATNAERLAELDRALRRASVDTLRFSTSEAFAQTLQRFFETRRGRRRG